MGVITNSIKAVGDVRTKATQLFKELPLLSPTREQALGLTHQIGDEVKDARTEERYKILAGTRKSLTVSTPRGKR